MKHFNTEDKIQLRNYINLLNKYAEEAKMKIKFVSWIDKELLEVYIKNLEKEIKVINKKI